MDIFFPKEKNFDNVTDFCVAAHQDDIEIMAYGPISQCYESNSFVGVVVTDGAGSPRTGMYENYTNEQMKEVRIKEQQKAAKIGNYRAVIQLGFPSDVVKDSSQTQVVDEIYKLLMKIKPENLYVHNPADKHKTHVAVLLRTISAIKKMPEKLRPKKVIGFEGWRSLDWVSDKDKICINTELYPELASDLVNVYDSQIAGGKSYNTASVGRRQANATFFESHNTDNCQSMNFAIDLTPLVYSDISVSDFILDYINTFKKDVEDTLEELI